MRTEKREITYHCDRCGKKINDVVFYLRCYAEPVNGGNTVETACQNITQNARTLFHEEKHLCRKCKNILTDGIFLL